MKRRLLDRFVLVDVRVVGCDFKLYPSAGAVLEPTNAHATIEVKPHNSLIENAPPGTKQVFESSVEVGVRLSPTAESSPFYELTLKILGLFSLAEGEPISVDDLAKDGQCFVRMLFPLARSEISRILGRARLPDLPLAWDTGISENKAS
jgi:preprotein translocase subunit SecB